LEREDPDMSRLDRRRFLALLAAAGFAARPAFAGAAEKGAAAAPLDVTYYFLPG
jgi:hypothetical protein